MKIVIVSDFSLSQKSVEVQRLMNMSRALKQQGHRIIVIQVDEFKSVPCPGHSAVRLALFPYRKLARKLRAIRPDAIHIETEGLLGLAARKYCIAHRFGFTSHYSGKISEAVNRCTGIPVSVIDCGLRLFHRAASKIFVEDYSTRNRLLLEGFRYMKVLPKDPRTGGYFAKQVLGALEPLSQQPRMKEGFRWQGA